MVQEFLPLLRRSEQPRIVNVSSEAASFEEMGLPDSGPTGGFFRDGRPLRW